MGHLIKDYLQPVVVLAMPPMASTTPHLLAVPTVPHTPATGRPRAQAHVYALMGEDVQDTDNVIEDIVFIE